MAVNWPGVLGLLACTAGIFIGDGSCDVLFKLLIWRDRKLNAYPLFVSASTDDNYIIAGKFQKGLYMPLPYPAIVPVELMDPDNLPHFGELKARPAKLPSISVL